MTTKPCPCPFLCAEHPRDVQSPVHFARTVSPLLTSKCGLEFSNSAMFRWTGGPDRVTCPACLAKLAEPAAPPVVSGMDAVAAPQPPVKPTQVEVGQRWRDADITYEAVNRLDSTWWKIRCGDGSTTDLRDVTILSHEYLGTVPAPVSAPTSSFDKGLGEAQEALNVVGTGKLRSTLVTEGARTYAVSAPGQSTPVETPAPVEAIHAYSTGGRTRCGVNANGKSVDTEAGYPFATCPGCLANLGRKAAPAAPAPGEAPPDDRACHVDVQPVVAPLAPPPTHPGPAVPAPGAGEGGGLTLEDAMKLALTAKPGTVVSGLGTLLSKRVDNGCFTWALSPEDGGLGGVVSVPNLIGHLMKPLPSPAPRPRVAEMVEESFPAAHWGPEMLALCERVVTAHQEEIRQAATAAGWSRSLDSLAPILYRAEAAMLGTKS